MSAPTLDTVVAAQEDTENSTVPLRRYVLVIHNDAVNTTTYVTWVFHTYFHLPVPVARTRMMEVHTRGRSILARGLREQMEAHSAAMTRYGLCSSVEEETDDAGAGVGA